jgi:hypothetical protein
MRAPSPTFKAAIAAYRLAIISNPAPVHLQNRWKYELTLEVLDRWEKHAAVETIWSTIKPKLEPAIPGLFINVILKMRIHAERVDKYVHELPGTKQQAVSKIKRLTTDEKFDKVRDWSSLVHDVSKGRARFSRKTESAALVDFMVQLRSWFNNEWGQPFDDVVATVTNIAFGLRPKPPMTRRGENEEVTADHVRDAARAVDRDIRPPK